MIKQKYPELELFDIDLYLMHGYNVPDPANRFQLIKNLKVGGSEIAVDQLKENEDHVKEKSTENANHVPPVNDESPQKNDNVINVSSD